MTQVFYVPSPVKVGGIFLCTRRSMFLKGEREYDKILRKRIETFRKDSKTEKAVQVVFVTTYGVETNQYSSIVQKQVTLEDLFREIID